MNFFHNEDMKTTAKRHYAKMSGHPLCDFFYATEVVSDELVAYYSGLELTPPLDTQSSICCIR
jgi:hypothetical protein